METLKQRIILLKKDRNLYGVLSAQYEVRDRIIKTLSEILKNDI